MAGLYICYNTGRASTNNNGIFIPTLTIFSAFIPILAEVFTSIEALTLAQTLTPGLPDRYINKNL